MGAVAAAVLMATLGVEAGWQAMPEGGVRYVLHLDAAAVDALRRGETIASDVPAELGAIHGLEIRATSDPAPRDTLPQPAPRAAQATAEGPATDNAILTADQPRRTADSVTALRPAPAPPGTPMQPAVPAPGPGDSDEPPPEQRIAHSPPAPRRPIDTSSAVGESPAPSASATALPDPATWIGRLKRLPDQQASPIQPAVGSVTRLPPVSQPAPNTLPSAQPLGDSPASIREHQLDTPAENTPAGNREKEVPPRETSRPWGALLAAVVGLFASVGGNLYLGWTTWGMRVRYRELLARGRRPPHDEPLAPPSRERQHERLAEHRPPRESSDALGHRDRRSRDAR